MLPNKASVNIWDIIIKQFAEQINKDMWRYLYKII